ncbi:MAG TPA: ATP-binding cassette domain-containing protein [Chthoniobacterales bacterium]|nr:ATP-binding cassette domain-containing protein [Chthoniobacterales bacterium]
MSNVGLKNVSKIYPGKKGADITAVRDFSLDLPEREFAVLTGPKGSGKSSVVRMIAGLEEITNGEIFLGDRRVNDVSPGDRDIALVAGNHALYPRMSVYDNLAFPLTLRKFSRTEIKKRVAAAAGIVELQESLERRPESLSAEERQRVALARALARQPKVFLFDEPFANLDATARARMRAQVKKLRQRLPATIIYATSDPVEAMAMGERVIVMNNGLIEQDGGASSVYQEPANMFVAGFIGSPPMNFVRGTIRLDRDSILFSEAGEGTIKLRLAISDFSGVKEFAGKPVVLGLRPEDIQIAQGSSNTFAAIVELAEPAGATGDLYLQTGAHSVVSRSRGEMGNVEAGHRSEFEVNVRKVHLFDPASGRRIT